MESKRLIAGLELGSNQFTLSVGEVLDRGRWILKAADSVAAQGLERGILSDPVECADALVRLMRKVEAALSIRLSKVLVAFPGSTLKSTNASASVPIPDPSGGISRRDVERVMSNCRTLCLDYNRQILHAFVRGFTVDGQSGVKDPVGLYGTKLSVDLHLVTALTAGVQNLVRVLSRAGLEVEEFLLPGLASAEAVLSDLDRDLGVTLISIGEFQTEALLWTDGQVRETFLVPSGIDHLVEGLARQFKLPRAAAEGLFEQTRTVEENPQTAQVPLRVRAGSLSRSFPQEQVSRQVGSRIKETLNRVRHRLDESPYFRESASGVVMVGSLARLEGFLEMAEELLNMPVRLGTLREVEREPGLAVGSAHTATIGLIRRGVNRTLSAAGNGGGTLWHRWVEKTRQLLEEYF
ncbi:MAG: cell division protein FtsA [Candidatus Omnitrophica bacterium]|nr:cell division protein FtsA [Candidatus Omnitrophota bacterium]